MRCWISIFVLAILGCGALMIDGATADGLASQPSCPVGSTLLVDRTCSHAVVAPPASLLSSSVQPGELVPLDGLDEGALPCVPVLVCRPDAAATMLFSDDPESPSSDGVLYHAFGEHGRLEQRDRPSRYLVVNVGV